MRLRYLPLVAVGFLGALLAGCGSELTDSSYTNPEWRASMQKSVTFPLAQELTLTVGLSSRMSRPDAENLSLQELRTRTNIRLQFVGLPDSPGDVDLGQMVRAGKLPDIVPEDRFDMGDEWGQRLFVNVLEFPGLTPLFRRRARLDAELRNGMLARTTEKGELYSLGTYRRDSLPYSGVLAYRRDLFEKEGLPSGTWDEIAASLGALKSAHPGSVPFCGFYTTVLALMPSWFGSGYDPDNLVYYDPERKNWFFGPEEDAFRDLVVYLADLYRRGLLNSDMFVGQEDMTSRLLSSDSAFMSPWRGATGPFFPYRGEGYGKLTDEGTWDGEGVWVESLPLPAPKGVRPRASATLCSRVAAGWVVYNQSPRASEALALLDLMYDEQVSLAMALGPEGTAWERVDGKLRLTGSLPEAYRTGNRAAVMETLSGGAFRVGLDLGGLEWSFFDALGFPEAPEYRYYLLHDLAVNRPGIDLAVQPGLRIPRDRSFQEARASLHVSLQTQVESAVANFIIGRKPIGEYDAFRAGLAKMGAGKLLGLYRERASLVDPALLDGSP